MFASIAFRYRRALSAVATLTLLFGAIAPVATVHAGTGDELFLSEYVEGSGFNKALEIYNPTDNLIGLAAGGYSLEFSFNGGTSTTYIGFLAGSTIPAGGTYVVTASNAGADLLAKGDQNTGTSWFNGDDVVLLIHNGTAIDSIGQLGLANRPSAGYWGTGDVTTQNHTLRRKPTITSGDPNADDAFDPAVEWDGYPQDTFDGLGSHTVATGGNQQVSATCPAPIQVLEGTAASGDVSATDPDGTVTSLAITDVTPSDPGTISLTGVTAATGVGATATGTLDVSSTTPADTYTVTITATNDDTTAQTGTCTATVTVSPILTIGEVQGEVTDSMDGATQASAYVGQTVFVQGVWTEKALPQTGSGGDSWTFFLQNTTATDDNDPLTSDGITVYTGRFPDFGYLYHSGFYVPKVGEEVVIRANVSEYFNLTELSGARLVSVIRDGVDLSSEIAQVDAAPPHDLAAAHRYWERLESMYVRLPAGASVTEGRNVFSSTDDGEMWMIAASDSLMQRSDPYARRVFRDPHPLDDLNTPANNFDNGNGERILLTSHGIKAAANDNTALIGPSHVFQTTTADLYGAVNYAYSKYGMEVTAQPALADGADPAANAAPQPTTPDQFSTSDYNVQNLYDFRDDPFDGCDFAGNSGCAGVSPPFDYVPASEAAYQQHLADIATQINGPMHDPDLLMIQEAEDQDICTVTNGAMDCGTTNNADGKPDVLQELALTISAAGGPTL